MSTKPRILIDDSLSIEQIQEMFNGFFPFLKIEFFSKSHEKGEGSAKNKMYYNNKELLKKIGAVKHKGSISMEGDQRVVDVEKIFKNEFGMNAQVFRKSGKVWLETTKTDNWTLNEQNEVGREMNEPLKIEKEDLNDRDVWL